MEINRRVLLGAVGLGAAVAAAGGSSAIAAAARPDPYLLAQSRLDEMVSRTVAYNLEFAGQTIPAVCRDHISRLGDIWLEDMLRDIAEPGTPTPLDQRRQYIEVRAMFDGLIELNSLEDLRKLSGTATTTAFAKASMSVHKLPFNTQKMSQFDAFADRFKHIILPSDIHPPVSRKEIEATIPPEIRHVARWENLSRYLYL